MSPDESDEFVALAREMRANGLEMSGNKLVWFDADTRTTYVATDFDNRDVTAIKQLEAAIAQRDADRQMLATAKLERQDQESRRAMIPLTFEDLERFFGLPDNVDVVGMHVDSPSNAIMLHVRSSEFDRVHPGSHMPILQGGWHREHAYLVRLEDGVHRAYDPDVDKPEESVAYVRFEWTADS